MAAVMVSMSLTLTFMKWAARSFSIQVLYPNACYALKELAAMLLLTVFRARATVKLFVKVDSQPQILAF